MVYSADSARSSDEVRLVATHGELQPTPATRHLLERVGGVPALEVMTLLFYQKFFADGHLRQFLGDMHTPLETHARRIAMYMAEMMGDSAMPWTKDTQTRPCAKVRLARGQSIEVNSRFSAHAAAWHSVARKPQDVGRRFKLDDCRVWMRLMFWACRESGLAKDETFFTFFQKWVGHFIPIYEATAQVFVRAEARWSADRKNLLAYEANQRTMPDVIGVPYSIAVRGLPAAEADDQTWPYE